MKRWGIALSGGAAYGIANAVVLAVLEREGLKPDFIGGSSMGAIVGAVFAFTGDTSAFDRLCSSLRMTEVARLSKAPFRGGLHGGLLRQNLEHLLGTVVGNACIGDCRIPFLCVAAKITEPIDWTNIVRAGFTDAVLKRTALHVFPPDTRLIDAVLASSAIPVVFSPVTIGNDEFVDLVHFGSIPARTLRERFNPDFVIGTDTNPRYKNLEKLLPKPWREFLDRGYEQLALSKDSCDLVIEPVMPASLFRFDRAPDFIAAGEKAAEEALPRLRSMLGRPQ